MAFIAACLKLQATPQPWVSPVSSELVVIIDDSATHLKILERLANSLGGWTVAKAFNDAEAALSFCQANPPGLVVLAAATAQGEAAGLLQKLHRIEGCAKHMRCCCGFSTRFRAWSA